MTATLLLTYGLATYQAITTWRTGTIFAGARAATEARAALYLRGRWRYFPDAALQCDCCLAHWVPAFLLAAAWLLRPILGAWCHLPAFSLAATAIATAIPTLAHSAAFGGSRGAPEEPLS